MRKRGPQARTIKKAQEGLAEFLKMAGVDTDAINLEDKFRERPEYTPREHRDNALLQSEGVLAILTTRAKGLIQKKCKRAECGEIFMSRYKGVAYCSNTCRGKEMESQIGVHWNYSTDHYEAMGVENPLVVGPQAYQALLEMCQRIVQGHQNLVIDESKEEIPQVEVSASTNLGFSLPQSSEGLDQESSQQDDPFGF